MIRISRPAAPAVLLEKGGAAREGLCNAYESAPGEYNSGARTFEFDHSIYAARAVKDALRQAQHSKCAFCESIFAHTGYGDVEHFRPKAGYKQKVTDKLKRPGYYWLAYEWANLFYSCQLCNQGFKQNLFPLKDGRRRARSHRHKLSKEDPLLVDPSTQEPALYISFREELAYAVGGCREGEATIEILGLNREELAEARRLLFIRLRLFVRLRELLREKVAVAATPDLVDQLRDVEETLRASTEATAEYAAMARALLN